MSEITYEFERPDEFFACGGIEFFAQGQNEYRRWLHFAPYYPDVEWYQRGWELGVLFVLVARERGVPVGVISGGVEKDAESTGVLVLRQGPWYVKPGRRYVAAGVAQKLFHGFLREGRLRGAAWADIGHPLTGRGRRVATYFSRLGAVRHDIHYRLDLNTNQTQSDKDNSPCQV